MLTALIHSHDMAKTLRALILEDNPADAELIQYELKCAGFAPECVRAESETEYRAHLQSNFDIILADHTLPEFDSLRALDILKSLELDIPFIIVSGTIGEDLAITALKRGAFDYLLKDRLTRLGQAVVHALEDKKHRQEKRQALEALRGSEERYRLIFEKNPHPMWLYELDTLRFLAVNEAASRDYGYSHKEFLTLGLKNICCDQGWSRFNGDANDIKETNQERIHLHTKKNGDLIEVEVHSYVLEFDARPVGISLITDITERRRYEAEVHRNKTMALLGALVSGVAHEVRNPLFNISSALDELEDNPKLDPDYRPFLDVFRRQIHRLNALMKDLLEYGHPIRHELAFGSLHQTIIEAVQECAHFAAQAGVKIETEVEPSIPPIKMDQKSLPQAFINLIENSIHHTPPGGFIRIKASLVVSASAVSVQCVITDTGPGFRTDDLPRLFEPFFTRRNEGVGLGLSIVRNILEAHSGSVSLENPPEGGARVTLRFPISMDRS